MGIFRVDGSRAELLFDCRSQYRSLGADWDCNGIDILCGTRIDRTLYALARHVAASTDLNFPVRRLSKLLHDLAIGGWDVD